MQIYIPTREEARTWLERKNLGFIADYALLVSLAVFFFVAGVFAFETLTHKAVVALAFGLPGCVFVLTIFSTGGSYIRLIAPRNVARLGAWLTAFMAGVFIAHGVISIGVFMLMLLVSAAFMWISENKCE